MTATALSVATSVAILATLATSQPAFGQRDGVFVDPDSPAGREYAVPLDQARREAVGGGGSGGRDGGTMQGSAQGEEPMFGVGIEPESGVGTRKPGDDGSAGAGEQGRGGTGGDGPAGSARSTGVVTAVSEGGSGLPLTIGVVALVLAAGVAAGVGLRRLLRGT